MEPYIIEIVSADPGILATEIADKMTKHWYGRTRVFGALIRMARKGELQRVEHVARIEGRGIEFYRLGYRLAESRNPATAQPLTPREQINEESVK